MREHADELQDGILHDNLPNRQVALKIEKELILKYRDVPNWKLINQRVNSRLESGQD